MPALPPAPPASPVDIEALADSLSACADELHTRLMRAIRAGAGVPGAPPPVPGSVDQGLSQGAAQALFENEVALRQRANGLYLDAALLAASGLDGQQHLLLDLTAEAQERIRKINRLKDLIDITGDLLALGAAVAAGQPEHLAAGLEKIRRHLAALKAGAPPPAA
jgi:hypothetical protein